MRKVLMATALVVSATALATGQTVSRQSVQSNTDEQEIISLSRQFANEAIINDALTVKGISNAHAKRITIVKSGEANPLEMDQIKVRIDGSKATLISRLVFSGRRSSGEAYKHFNKWTVDLVKQGGRWQVVSGRMTDVGKYY